MTEISHTMLIYNVDKEMLQSSLCSTRSKPYNAMHEEAAQSMRVRYGVISKHTCNKNLEFCTRKIWLQQHVSGKYLVHVVEESDP